MLIVFLSCCTNAFSRGTVYAGVWRPRLIGQVPSRDTLFQRCLRVFDSFPIALLVYWFFIASINASTFSSGTSTCRGIALEAM